MNANFAVLYAPGTNCHRETAFAIEYVGGNATVVSIGDLMQARTNLSQYNGLVIPGGFSWGDHLGAGRIFAIHLIARLSDSLKAFAHSGKPILGICNGYQVLVETGLLPGLNVGQRRAALLQNKSARFESRMTRLTYTGEECYWTRSLVGKTLRIPVAHGEGRYFEQTDCPAIRAFRYIDESDEPTESYPANPAASADGIAGTVDSTGMVLGMMPHPERAVQAWHESQDGLAIMRNLISE